jgi:predicted DCC family thiol-disulfide oxidoreductase YuxK
MKKLYVFYDVQCAFCLRCRSWLGSEPAFIPLEFVPLQSPEVVAKFDGIQPHLNSGELVVLSDEGGVYKGTNAFIMCLYALQRYRPWALRLATPAMMPLAAKFFDVVSSRRKQISRWLDEVDDHCLQAVLESQPQPECCNGADPCAVVR